MCSKPIAPTAPYQDDLHEDDVFGSSGSPGDGAKSQLLGRIAKALQVPQSTLYDPAAVLVDGADGVGDVDAGIDQECLALLRAYTRISDPNERRRLLALVQEASTRI